MAAIQAVATGQFDMGGAQTGANLLSIMKGLDLRLLGTQGYDATLGIVVPEKGPIKTPKDLEGRKIGVSAAGGDTPFLPAYCRLAGVDFSKVSVVQLDSKILEQGAMSGIVDAIVVTGLSSIPNFVSENFPIRMMPFSEVGLQFYWVNTLTNGSFLAKNKELVDNVQMGILEGMKFMLLNPQEAMERHLKEHEELATRQERKAVCRAWPRHDARHHDGAGIDGAWSRLYRSCQDRRAGEGRETVCRGARTTVSPPKAETFCSNNAVGKVTLTAAEWDQVKSTSADIREAPGQGLTACRRRSAASAYARYIGKGAAAFEAVAAATFSIDKGEFVCLLGPSGCGKSTLLMMIAGLEARDRRKDSRRRHGDGRAARGNWHRISGPDLAAVEDDASECSVSDRDDAQEPFGLPRACNGAAASRRLDDAVNKRPSQLSGGMRQRVSLCRALIADPGILLMDEPFSALDAITRDDMNIVLLELWERYRKTVLFVTHSIREAVMLSDRVLVMGRSPSKIIAEIEVPFARPRDFAIGETSRNSMNCAECYGTDHQGAPRRSRGPALIMVEDRAPIVIPVRASGVSTFLATMWSNAMGARIAGHDGISVSARMAGDMRSTAISRRPFCRRRPWCSIS